MRSKQTNTKQKPQKNTNQTNTKPNNPPKTIEIDRGETVKRETYRTQTLKASLICPSSAKSPSSSTSSHIPKHFFIFRIHSDWFSFAGRIGHFELNYSMPGSPAFLVHVILSVFFHLLLLPGKTCFKFHQGRFQCHCNSTWPAANTLGHIQPLLLPFQISRGEISTWRGCVIDLVMRPGLVNNLSFH